MADSYLISVSLMTGCYRHIQISGRSTLYKLHMAIQEAFSFDNDHPHGFFMDNHLWSRENAYFGESLEEKKCETARYTLNRLKLKKGDTFKYLFDFGHEWVFQCRILRELTEDTLHPVVVRSVGDSPEQYPDDDWDADDWDGDDGDEDDWDENCFPEIYVADQLSQMYQALSLPEETVNTIQDYFTAAANLYGIIPLGKLLEIYNQQNSPISQEAFLEVAEVIRHEEHYYSILGQECFCEGADVSAPIDREIVGDWLYECGDDDYHQLCEAQAGKPFAILPKDEFLRYADQYYYPVTPESQAMTAFLKKKLSGVKIPVQDVVTEMMLHVFMDGKFEDAVQVLEYYGMVFRNTKSVEEFMEIYTSLNNHSRKQVNRGYSPVELAGIMGTPIEPPITASPHSFLPFHETNPIPATISGTPARNAPCPCGSGRKYKNCCGKK